MISRLLFGAKSLCLDWVCGGFSGGHETCHFGNAGLEAIFFCVLGENALDRRKVRCYTYCPSLRYSAT